MSRQRKKTNITSEEEDEYHVRGGRRVSRQRRKTNITSEEEDKYHVRGGRRVSRQRRKTNATSEAEDKYHVRGGRRMSRQRRKTNVTSADEDECTFIPTAAASLCLPYSNRVCRQFPPLENQSAPTAEERGGGRCAAVTSWVSGKA